MITSFKGKYVFLSNFYAFPISCFGHTAQTVEHLFQAVKTDDEAERLFVLSASTAGQAKRRGRSVTLRADWSDVRLQIMGDLLYQKFRNQDLRERLIATGRRTQLIEGNTWGDTYWGAIEHIGEWRGENHLGRLLMALREFLCESTP